MTNEKTPTFTKQQRPYTSREIPADKALEDYSKHLELAKTKILALESAPTLETPGIATLKLIRGDAKGELTPETAETFAKKVFEDKDIYKFAVVSSLSESHTFTQRRLSEHREKVGKGNRKSPDVDQKKEQFLRGELVRKDNLAKAVQSTFHSGTSPSKELIEDVGKELVSQSRVQLYGEKFKTQDLTNALAFKHTCEQCIGYLKMLGKEPVKQHLGRDGKMWICPTEQLRDQALLKQHQLSNSSGMSLER